MSKLRLTDGGTQRGFTLVEMLVIAPIVILTVGAFITAIVNMTGDVLASRGSNVLAYSVQDALNHIEDDVKLSTTFLAVNNITLTTDNPQGYGDDTTNFTNVDATKGNMLILNTLATTGNPISSTGGLVYLNGQPNDCATNAAQVNQNTPMTMNVVYYVKTVDGVSSLWRRTIAPLTAGATTAGCNISPWQQPSCTPGYTHAFCKTQDIRLIDGINPSDFIVQYFNTADATTADSVASDTGPSDSVRASALQTDATVGATINITKNIAGRTISQVGTLRATRLDINASTIAPIVPDIVPSAPTVIASPINPLTPTTATFTWATVPGATGYTFEYRIDAWNPVALSNSPSTCASAGSYTTGFTNQTTTTFSVAPPTVKHGDRVCARVTATSPAGPSGYGTSNITIPLWASFRMQNNWSDYHPTFAPAAFTKTSSGMVILKGLVKGGTATTGTVIAALPAGYAPSDNLIFENTTNQTFGRADVWSDGTVRFNIGSNAWFSLDGISFMPTGTSFNAMSPLLNGWVAYGGGYSAPAYVTDSAGRVHTKGLVSSGTTTSGTPIATLPTGSRPDEYYHFTDINSNGNSHISIGPLGNVVVKAGGNSFLSLQSMFYPSGRTTGTSCTTQWCNLTLLNSWVVYAGYATPQYTKSSDGMVLIKGLVKTGNGAIANLPPGYCPKNQLLLTVQQNATWERLDITAGTGSGCSIVPLTMNTPWTALDSISYLAEW